MVNLIYYGMLFFIHVTAPLFLVIYSVNDGKHQGVNGNIRSMLSSMLDIIAGTFFVCDCSGENFGGLSPDQLRRYTELFKCPERFFRAGNDIKAVPYIPERSQER